MDGATSDDERNSSVGVVIRDSNESDYQSQLAWARPFQVTTWFRRQKLLLWMDAGILLALEMELRQIILESDSLTVDQGVLSNETSEEAGHLIHGIISLPGYFGSWQIRHLKWDYNRVAHELTWYARYIEINQVWKGVSPPILRHLLHLDCL